MKIRIAAKLSDAIVIQELLSPWDATYTEFDDADVSIYYGVKPISEEHSVVIPSASENFKTWEKRNHLKSAEKRTSLFLVPATNTVSLSIKPEFAYSYELNSKPFLNESESPFLVAEDEAVLFKVDLVKEYFSILDSTLRPTESKLHRLVTGIPFAYRLAPKGIRDFFMKSSDMTEDINLTDKLPMDALRFSLVNAIEKASNRDLEKKALYSDNYVCVLTHDIETLSGMQKARVIKKIEEKYDARSAWYIPSKRYKLEEDCIKKLAYHGEIGVHDTKHDGKLAHLQKAKLIERFSDAKTSIETISEHKVEGFRAPVLQHNSNILQALRESGFKYDTSIPTWEPKHPFTMKPHGIGTVYPITINGITEIPLTLPQDHQLLYVLRMNPEQVMRTWAIMASLIRELGGVCMFLVHPDYKFGDPYTSLYEEIVNTIISDQKAMIALPSRLCGLIKEYEPDGSCFED